jgi:hypothetical protein
MADKGAVKDERCAHKVLDMAWNEGGAKRL